MARNSINIDGEKLRNIVELRLGLNIYSFCEANGYSRNLVAQAIRSGKASPLVQNLLRLYSVDPSEYIYKEPIKEDKAPAQMSIDDITPITRAELKEIVKESFIEVLNSLTWRLDTKTNTVTFLVGNSEAKVNGDKK